MHSRFAHVHSTYNLTRDWPGPHRGAPYGRDASGHIYADQMLRIRGANGCKSCRFSPNSYQLRHFFGPFNMFNNAMEIYFEECACSDRFLSYQDISNSHPEPHDPGRPASTRISWNELTAVGFTGSRPLSRRPHPSAKWCVTPSNGMYIWHVHNGMCIYGS